MKKKPKSLCYKIFTYEYIILINLKTNNNIENYFRLKINQKTKIRRAEK